jgi:hypothetical protein
MHTCNSNTQEAVSTAANLGTVWAPQQVQGQPELLSKTLSENTKGWGYNSVVEYLPSMCKILSSIHSTAKNKLYFLWSLTRFTISLPYSFLQKLSVL